MSPHIDADDSTLPPSTPSKEKDKCSTEDQNNGNIASTSASRTSVKARQKSDQLNIATDTFVTIHAESGKHHSKFRILPFSRASNPKYSGAADKLTHCILKGGGLVVNGREGELSPRNSHNNVIKILDVEFIRANIQATQDMLLPYDCFSSSFIWNQIYRRSLGDVEKRDADLNLFRISPSAHVSHDANLIFQGAIAWDDVQPISSEKLAPAIRIKEVALQLFPELVVFSRRMGPSKARRVYTRHESQMLLDTICEMDAHDRIQGISLYNEIASTVFPDRTGASLKEHFRKTILPHVIANDRYYGVAAEDLVKFKMAADKDGRMELRSAKKRRLQQQPDDAEEDNEDGYFTP